MIYTYFRGGSRSRRARLCVREHHAAAHFAVVHPRQIVCRDTRRVWAGALSLATLHQRVAHELLRYRRTARNSIKLFLPSCTHQPTKIEKEREREEEKSGAVHNRGRIELSALNFAFYARDWPALSTTPNGDIINVNCTNCTVIARLVSLPPSAVRFLRFFHPPPWAFLVVSFAAELPTA